MPTPSLTEQTKVVIKAFELPWYVDAESGHVRVGYHGHMPDLFKFLQDKGYSYSHPYDQAELSKAHQRKDVDMITYVETEGLVRVNEESFLEIFNPELNRFIKEEILGLPKEEARGRA